MDSVTQFVLGAAVGEATLGKKLGNKAPLLGGFFGSLPDIDVFFASLYKGIDGVLVHRGLSHSLFFAVFGSLFFAWLFTKHRAWLFQNIQWSHWLPGHEKLQKRTVDQGGLSVTFKEWYLFFFAAIITHIGLDYLTNYGTALLYPFSNTRFGLNVVFDIDPFYTLPLLIFLILAMCRKAASRMRIKFNKIGLYVSCAYLLMGIVFRMFIIGRFESAFATDKIPFESVYTINTPFNNWFWAGLVETREGFYLTVADIFNHKKFPRLFIKKNEELIKEFKNHPAIKKMVQFTRGKHVFEQVGDKIFMSDLHYHATLEPLFVKNTERFLELMPKFQVAEKLQNGEWKVGIKKLTGDLILPSSDFWKNLKAEAF